MGDLKKKISCKHLSEEKNCMQHKYNRKLMRKKREKNIMPTRLLDKILDDQKSPPPPQELNDRPLSTLKQLYYTLIYPYLTYGLMSWGTAYQNKLNKIKVSQNNCIRCIFFANKRESLTPYFTLLEILKLENIFKLKIGALVHKIQ